MASDSTWLLGLAFGLFGSIGVNTGNNLQSLGLHNLAKAHENDETKPPNTKSKLWVIGTALFILASLANFAAFAFAPAALLASLEATQFATNILFGRFILGSYVSPRMYLGTFLVITATIGVVLSFAFADTPEIEYEVEDVLNCFISTKYIVFIVFMIGLAIFLHLSTNWLRAQNVLNKKSGVAKSGEDWKMTFEPVCYAAFSAIFGTQAVVQAKCLALLLSADGAFSHWLIYVTLVGWLSFVFVWLTRMNDALGMYSALFIIPLLQANYILLAIINGGIFFDEFRAFKAGHWVVFALGLVGIFIGLYYLRPEVGNDHEIDSQIEAEEKTAFIASQEQREEQKGDKGRKSAIRRKSSIGGIPLPPAGMQRKKTRASVYLPPSEQEALYTEGGDDQKIQMKRRASKLGIEKRDSQGDSTNQPKVKKMVKKIQMKRISLASSYTQAHLMDVRLTERMTTSNKPRVESIVEMGGGEDSDEDNFL
ncbi:hypothetical protein TrLO_g12170 [Triparma laevis f. longispina]|uniref:Magnesium transporter n=1 Tax=Triparma laevis f. longispina TaxID=1714387 RepID=A0A9W7C2A7_9STRA|nr:hypothetical protein TrLO_g12170 [Triparma laevis f. longispina]